MTTLTRSCIVGSLLIAAPFLLAQAKPAASAQTPATSVAGPSKAPAAHSRAEAVALTSLNRLAADSTTTPAQMDAAITDFVTKYPTSNFIGTAYVLGLEYYSTPAHADYAKSLDNGEQALKADPNELFALVTLSTEIADHVDPTDLDFAQRAQEASDDAHKAITVAEADAAAGTVNGRPFTTATRNAAESAAYSALGKLASVKKDYAGAVSAYKTAATFDDPTHQTADYFYAARAEIQAKQYKSALALLNQAESADPNVNPQVKAVIDANIKLVQKAMSGGN